MPRCEKTRFAAWLTAACILSTWLAATGRACEPSLVLAPPFIQGAVSDAEAASLSAAVEQVFRSHGCDVRTLAPGADARTVPCSSNACALEHASAAGTTAALQLSIFRGQDDTFSLALVMPPSHAFVYYSEPIELDQPDAVLASAAKTLLAQYAMGPGPWLRVRGEPHGAAVKLDGQVIGLLPLTKRVSSGEHLLVVSSAGYEDFNTTIRVDGSAGTIEAHTVRLAAVPPKAEGRAAPAPPRHRGWVAASTLVGLGAASVLLPTLFLDACLDSVAGQCVEQRPPTRSAALLSAGASLAVASGILTAITIRKRRATLHLALARLSGVF